MDRRYAMYDAFEKEVSRVLESLAWRIRKQRDALLALEQTQAEARSSAPAASKGMPEFNYDRASKKLLKKMERKLDRYCKSLGPRFRP